MSYGCGLFGTENLKLQNWYISALADVLDLCWGTSFLSPLGQQLENPDLSPPSEILVPGAQGGALAQHP